MNAPAPADRPRVPAKFRWDTADRMRKALRVSGVSIEEMAEYLGVSRRSVGNWIGGRVDPSVQTLRLWALRTGAPLEWLHHGDPDEPCDFTLVTVPDELAARRVSAAQGAHNRQNTKMHKLRAAAGA